MNRYLLFLIYTFFTYTNGIAQWVKIYEFPEGERDIRDLNITSDTSIYLTEMNRIYKSVDKGLSWETMYVDSFDSEGELRRIFTIGNDTAYVTKDGGSDLSLCLRTTEGGASWENISPGGTYQNTLFDVFALNAEDVYFTAGSGTSGCVIVSHDACENTTLYYPDIFFSGNIAGIICVNTDTCVCIAGEPFYSPGIEEGHTIYKSYDGGITWMLKKYLASTGIDIYISSKKRFICINRINAL